MNKKGEKLIEICNEYNLEIVNGRSMSDKEGNYTFINKRGNSVIDLCLASGEAAKEIIDMKIGEENWSDHMPIEIKMKVKKTTEKVKELSEKITVRKEKAAIFKEKFRRELDKSKENEDSEKELKNIIETIKRSAPKKNVKRIEKKNPWYNSECEERKMEMRKALNSFRKGGSEEQRVDYVEKRKSYKEIMDDERRKFYEKFAEEINTSKDSKIFWKSINTMRGGRKANEIYVDAEDMAREFRRTLYEPEQITKRVKGDMKNEELDEDITEEEVKEAIGDLKNNKSPGPDRIAAEMYKEMPHEGKSRLARVMNRIWVSGKMPKTMKDTIIFPIYKKGKKRDPRNYRGVSFLNSTSKIFTKILQKRMEKFLEENNIIVENQAGYRKGRTTIDHVYVLKGIIDINEKKGKKVYTCFLDLSSIRHGGSTKIN